MSLDAIDRILIKIILISFLGIVYLLRDKYYGNVGDGAFVSSERDSIPIVMKSKHKLQYDSPSQSPVHVHLEQPKGISTLPLFHQKKVQFLHSAVEFRPIPRRKSSIRKPRILFSATLSKSERSRDGLFASGQIPFGTILCVEDPIINKAERRMDSTFDEFTSNLLEIENIVNEQSKDDPEFKRIWESLPLHSDSYLSGQLKVLLKAHNKPMDWLDHYIRFAFHKIPGHRRWIIYSVIGRLRFDLPPNAMIVVGGKESGYKAALIATREIAKDEEIVVDHFMDWSQSYVLQQEPNNLKERQLMCNDRGFDLNEKWIAFFKQLQDESLSDEQEIQQMLRLYPNGLIGKSPDDTFRVIEGCQGMESIDCHKKEELTKAIDSGDIFQNKHETVNDELSINQCPDDDKWCSEQKEDYLQKEHRLIVDRIRNQFEYDPESIKNRKLMTHPVHTKFVHSALELKYFGDDKQYGLITTKKVPFGSVLAVEYPMLKIKEHPSTDGPKPNTVIAMDQLESMMNVVDESVEEQKRNDEHFNRIWNEEFKANKLTFTSWLYTLNELKRKLPSERMMIHWAKFNTFWFGGLYGHKPLAVYPVLSRINYGIPQNVAAIFGDKKDDFVFVLIATRDLEEGEELQLDYLKNLHSKKGISKSNEWVRANRGPEFGWKWTDDLKALIGNIHSDGISKTEKRKLMHDHLYSNGIIGKQSGDKLRIINGCGDWMTKEDCDTKKAMKVDIESGDLFRVVRKMKPPKKWMGTEFANCNHVMKDFMVDSL